MHWSLELLCRTSDDIGRKDGVWMRALIMMQTATVIESFFWDESHGAPEKGSNGQVIASELQQRKWLLVGVDSLALLPIALTWLVGAMSFVRPRWSRTLVFGGQVILFFVFLCFSMTIGWATGDILDLRGKNGRFVSYSAVYSHLGLAIGCHLSTTSMAKRLVPSLANGEDSFYPEEPTTLLETCKIAAKDEESKLPEDVKGEAQNSWKKALPTKHVPTAWHAALMIWVAAVLVSKVVNHDLLLFLCTECLRSRSAKLNYVLSAIGLILLLGLYIYLVYDYPKRTTYLLRETIIGTLFAVSSFATLRLSSSVNTWQSWTIDGLLAFIGFHFGIFVGYRSRVGL